MTQPDDPTHALPPRPVPPHPTTPPPTDDPTVHLDAAEPTMHLDAAEPTMHLGRTETAARPDTAESTVSRDGTVPWGTFDLDLTQGTPYQPPGTVAATSATGGTPGGAYPGRSGTVRTTAARSGALAAPTTGPGGELRFGPGVPAAPPSAPAWPAPPPRRRSLWRRLVSALSTVLTLALLAAVGLWIWQRMNPLEISGVSVAVPRPAGERCDVTVDVIATVRTNGRPGTIEYQWLRSGSAPGTLLTERVGPGQRTVELTLRWTFSGVGSTTETATVNIVAPSSTQAVTEVAYSCPG
ncbi:hypothetical protein [Micromonospora craniellae]|uniref:Uncharacterized protein n=1 Tax=Micromonospora craniellae TaxID=2294034 RepID=A0A372FR37_9ACTN|nr:hypothetical protein [Micromonospora craniellae]QOC91794.1 hypothetical protein ID554_28410 [Micromonospora craniellae]RFS43247.1 hypothetical protein D0Q02_28885 [Micromonospora craniellae]